MMQETNAVSGRLTVTAEAPDSDFSTQQAKAIVADLFEPNAAIYWSDFLLTATVGYGCVAAYLMAPVWSPVQVTAFVIAGLALFRLGTFMHEIVHMRKDALRGFKAAWNVLCGIPLFMPSIMYESHADHHSRHYGTPQDGEYLPLAAGPVGEIVRFLAMVPVLPVIVVIRFLILAPISMLHPRLRRWVLERASSHVCNPYYRRRILAGERRRLRVLVDLVSFCYLATVAALVASGVIAPVTLLMLYLLVAYSLGLNWVRNLAAHRYRNIGGEMSHIEQMLDSINVVGHPLVTELLFPVGLRYHALHHLFPTMPYHALGRAHRRLMGRLPEGSPYRRTEVTGYWAAVRQLWKDARAFERGRPAPIRVWQEALG
jgi:fatty acid desaturase